MSGPSGFTPHLGPLYARIRGSVDLRRLCRGALSPAEENQPVYSTSRGEILVPRTRFRQLIKKYSRLRRSASVPRGSRLYDSDHRLRREDLVTAWPELRRFTIVPASRKYIDDVSLPSTASAVIRVHP